MNIIREADLLCPNDKTFYFDENAPEDMRRDRWSLENFSVLHESYRGVASYIFNAYCKKPYIHVALKVYRLKKLGPMQRCQLVREINIHSQLNGHPNILRLYCIFKQGNIVVFVQKYMKNGDLFNILKLKQNLFTQEFVFSKIITPLLSTLNYLHSKNIIHRDIKLENILVDKEWNIKLCDFGLSINCSEELPVTRVGTREYMAPEVLSCPIKKFPEENKNNFKYGYDKKIDMYSLGVLIYELILKKTPSFKKKIALPDDIDERVKHLIAILTLEDPKLRPDIDELLKMSIFNQNKE
jgi:serine/threonine protein kinase